MNYNLKIIFSITIVFVMSFSVLITFLSVSAPKIGINELQNEFYSKDFPVDVNRIFIIGASQTASLNATYIENQINKNNQNYEVYNLSIAAGRPTEQLQKLDQLIFSKPTLVIYGVGFVDFENSKIPLIVKPESIFPDPEEFFRSLSPFKNSEFINSLQSPKFVTLQTLRDSFFKNEETRNLYFDDKAPFFTFDLNKKRKILNQEELIIKAKLGNYKGIKPLDRNSQVQAFQEIINKFDENDIKLIVISVPFPKPYFEVIPDYYEDRFNSIFEKTIPDSSKNYYSFLHNYENMEIWSDLHHISMDESITYFNDDIVQLILEEFPPT